MGKSGLKYLKDSHTNRITFIYTNTGHWAYKLQSTLCLFICTNFIKWFFWLAIKQSLFYLAGHPSHASPPPPRSLQPHYSRISFLPRIPLKCCHVGWRQSAETLLRYSCSFSKAPNSIYGHIYYRVCQWLKGSFIIRSTHLIRSQQAASLGQHVLYYTVRVCRSTEENMSKQKMRSLDTEWRLLDVGDKKTQKNLIWFKSPTVETKYSAPAQGPRPSDKGSNNCNYIHTSPWQNRNGTLLSSNNVTK